MASIAPPHNAGSIFESLFPPLVSSKAAGLTEAQPSLRYSDSRSEAISNRHNALEVAKSFLSLVDVRGDVLSQYGVRQVIGQLESRAPVNIQSIIEICLLDWPDLDSYQDDLVDWYVSAIRHDFYPAIEPVLNEIWSAHNAGRMTSKLRESCEVILYAQQIYTFPITSYMLPALERLDNRDHELYSTSKASEESRMAKLSRITANVLQPVFMDTEAAVRFYAALTSLTLQSCSKYFRLDEKQLLKDAKTYDVHHESGVQLLQVFEHLQHVGLGGKPAMRAFAEAIEEVIVDFIHSHWMAVDWHNQDSVIPKLAIWVEKVLAPFVNRGQALLEGRPALPAEDDMARWLEVAILWLGKARIENLYSYVCSFPESSGALQDIKAYIASPEARKHLTSTFQQDIERRLLHAGAPTKHILDVYILLIQTFVTIDSRGVLLDNVSRPIRRYLKTRADTSKIIIASMLADSTDETSKQSAEVSLAIAAEMDKPLAPNDTGQRQDSDLDFDNMEYLPQPIDASSDFVRNQSSDTISHLLSLYDKEQFVNVLKGIFGEHLLKVATDSPLTKETHLLKLFKSRFGDDKVQACDVMLQDIIDSRALHKTINDLPQFKRAAAKLPVEGASLTTQVLSSFFWPEMRDDEFALPEPIRQIQHLYEQGFMHRHSAMKLKWLPSLGRATVELQLEDRSVIEVVPTWVASVIYAFDESKEEDSASKSIQDLAAELEMDEPLVRNAVHFWVGKRVLQESEGRYHVVESLPDENMSEATPGRSLAAQEEVSAVKSAQDVLDENADMYMMFVQGMLMNQGAMPVPRILMMLKIALPGGFPFGDAEVKALLLSMVDAGRLVQHGETFGVRK